MKILELLNAVSMIFPLLAWRKHRRTSNSKLKSLMLLHIPISFTFHLLKSFHNRSPTLDRLFKMDILCIHASSVISSLENSTTKSPILPLVSIPFHIYSFLKPLNKNLRCSLIVLNNANVIRRCKIINICIRDGSLALICYLSQGIGHPIFHIFLYNVYDNYFTMMKDTNIYALK